MKFRFSHIAATTLLSVSTLLLSCTHATTNPIVTDVFTADPSAMVHGDTVYLYAGQDESPGNGYVMNRWLCYSSKDMKTWTAHGSPLAATDFSWASGEAWASQVIEKNGKFYWFSCVEHKAPKWGKAIGVAVSDSPTGPFKDVRGSALITADMTSNGGHGWEDIDPSVFTDTDGTSYLFWGNTNCFYAKLKPNMTELDGPIIPVELPWFTEAPWIHKRGNLYYLSYASHFPEKIAYATATKITGPWTYRGLVAEVAGNSNTIHQAIIEFKNQWYFIYHNGALPSGGSFRRSVCVDYLYYNPDGTMRRIMQTTEGINAPAIYPTTPDVSIVPQLNRLQSFANPNVFVRHANYKGVLSPSPTAPYMDSMWQVGPGLSDSKAVSIQSLNFPDHFLRPLNGEVVLAKNDNSAAFKRSATFLKEPGLANPAFSSFRSADGTDLYLRQSNGALRVGAIATPDDRRDATFRITNESAGVNSPTAKAQTPVARGAALTPISSIGPLVPQGHVETSTPVALKWNNPIVPQRADPHVTLQADGNYYLTASVPKYDCIELRRAKSLGGLSTAEPKIAWRRPASGPMSGFIWAPELHRIAGKWYVYFAAGHARAPWDVRMYVLENPSPDPFVGTWTEKGQLKANWDSFSLDATTFEHRGVRYLAWAQAALNAGVHATNIYLAKMDTPWSITGSQVLISAPTLSWERIGHFVNEAPAVLIKNGRVFMTYSASATDANYCLGLLTAKADADWLDPKSWAKSPEPVFRSSRENSQYGPGHNSFTTTPDGKTDILVYHARNYEQIAGDPLYNPDRATRAQVIQWKPDGTPNFGVPAPDGPYKP